jgi:crotonobetainyl-CoA:carnitine CoA-transferase CaiB-like acyl-CoA transferase
MLVKMDHASGQEVTVIANPVKLSATPPDYRSAAPVLGQHTEEVLASLGMSQAEIEQLKADKIV